MNTTSKRGNFASIQSSHLIGMIEMKSCRLLTGAEAAIASKVGKPFVYTAKANGVVEKITKSQIDVIYKTPIESNKILLLSDVTDLAFIRAVYEVLTGKGYVVTTSPKDKVLFTVYLGSGNVDKSFIKIKENKFLLSSLKTIPPAKTIDEKASYSLDPWSSKIEGNSSIKHLMTTSLRVGEHFGIDEAITYDASFFEPNIYDKKSIITKMGSYARVAFIEKKGTYEDSIQFNSAILEKTGELKYKVLSKVLDVNSHITNVLPEGTEVKYNDKLMTIIDSALVLDSSLTDRAREILSDSADSSPKANANGIIEKIDVIYNCDLAEMDESIRKLADVSNKRFKKKLGVDGKVTNEYSINGNPLLPGQIELKYYISSISKTKIGDKFILGHQLKNTLGDIVDNVRTEDGKSVDVIFAVRSNYARIVNSGFEIGTTNLLMKHFTDNAIKAYRRK